MEHSITTSIRRGVYQSLAGIDSLVGTATPRVTILCYHAIDTSGWYHSVTAADFAKQMDALSKKYDFVSLNDVVKYCLGKKNITKPSVCITFDDGYKSVAEVQPTLKKYKISPTVFVLSNPEKANRNELENNLKFLSVTEVKKLQKDGWEVGSHTATHADLTTIDTQQLKTEIIESKKTIQKKYGTKPRFFAYPKGRYTTLATSMTEEAYEAAVTMDDGFITTKTDINKLPRVGVNGSHTAEELLASLSPLNTQFRKLVKIIL